MPQYRVEVSPNQRATCQEKQCKDNAVKLQKGELRFGVWVEVHDHGSWRWKHWGCVSGQQLENLRDAISTGDGDYDFDMVDGYDEMGDFPEFQQKIRTAMIEGKIADEDFKGDPEFNVLGKRGIRCAGRKSKAKDDEGDTQEGQDDGAPAASTTADKKRGLGKKAVTDVIDDEEPEAPPAKKTKTVRGAKKVHAEDEEVPEEKTSKKTRGKKVKAKPKVENKDEELTSVKEEDLDDKPTKSPVKKAKVEPTIKPEDVEEGFPEEVEDEVPIKQKKHKKGRSKKVKAEPDDDQAAIESQFEEPKKSGRVKKIKTADLKKDFKQESGAQDGIDDGDSDFKVESESEPAPKKRAERLKKAAANGTGASEVAAAPKKRRSATWKR